jgi:putative ABC transport system permease protein
MMFINNLRIAYRNLNKNRIFSYINILGLAIGMATFLFIVQYVRFERSYENFHKNATDILRITTEVYKGSEYLVTDCESYAPLGPFVKDKMPEVVDYVRMYGIDGFINVKSEKHNFLETGFYWADHSVLKVFTYPAVSGNLDKALIAPFEVVLTETMAQKYFGRTNIIDESIEIDKNTYRIKAVIADVPENTHLKFSFLLSRLSLATLKPWYPDDKWNNNNEFTYVLTQPGTDLASFNKKLATLTATELKDVITHERFVAERIGDIHLYSANKSYEPEPAGDAKVVYYFSLIALFIIAIAWVNYVNLATARAVERAREVGIRKVMGSLKRQLVFQFLAESFIVNCIAGILALILFQLAFPFFRELSGQPLPFSLNDPALWILLPCLIVIGALLSGIYPAFVLASFNPAAVLKGKFQSSAHGQVLRKGLVVFQFSATVVLLISMCTIYLQVKFLRNQDLGMNIDQTLVLTGRQLTVADSLIAQTSQAFKNELMRDAAIQSVTRGESLPGVDMQELSTTSIRRIGESDKDNRGYMYYCFAMDADYAPTMNMSFVAGRNFENGVPNRDQIIINEESVPLLGFASAEEAVGSKVTFRSTDKSDGSTIIGVLKNFYFRSPKEGHLPMFFYYGEPSDYIAMKVSTGDMNKTVAGVKSAWTKVYPNTVFNYFFLNEKYDQQYRSDAQFGNVMAAFSVLIIFIACLGLFGLSSYTITQRTKEIGIRKVLGANVTQIVQLLSVDFAKTVIIAALLALPIAYVAMNEWLSNYFVRISLNAWLFVLPIAVVLVLAMITVSFQTIKTAVANPTDSLKQE